MDTFSSACLSVAKDVHPGMKLLDEVVDETGVAAPTVRRTSRARRLSLRVSNLDGRITLTAPKWAPQSEIERFWQKHMDWALARLAKMPRRVDVGTATSIVYRGQDFRLVPTVRKDVRIDAADLLLEVPAEVSKRAAAIRTLFQAEARTHLESSSRRFATKTARDISAIVLRDPRSRWGSCSANGRLMFSWRLVMAPPVVLDYVAAHEVAHLTHMNHGAEFWELVARLCPDFKTQRRWLRENGGGLHRFDFAN